MKTIKLTSILVIVFLITLISCKKDPGFGGKTDMKGTVTYKDAPVENAIVRIAFDTKAETTEFDATTITDAEGKYSFSGLTKGEYFVDAEYTNGLEIKLESGGAHVTVGGKPDVTVDLTVQ